MHKLYPVVFLLGWYMQGHEDAGHPGCRVTKYGSTLYIGMDEVLTHYACTFKNSFTFSYNPLLTQQSDS